MRVQEQPASAASADVAEANRFRITGMTCQNCVRHAREALQGVAGVARVKVDLASGAAAVTWAAGAAPNVGALIKAVEECGFAIEEAAERPSARAFASEWRFNVALGALALLPMMAGEWIFPWGHARWFHWLSFLLAAPVQTFCGARFYRGAWGQLKSGNSNMDTLVALGSTTAFGFSLWGLISGTQPHLYFMEAAAIITLISAGHWMESLASARATAAAQKLLNLAPAQARLLDERGEEKETPVAQLKMGDLILLKPGDRVPVDAEVVEGQSAVDETMLTGESMPVEKAAASRIFAGTVNQNGRLVGRVMALGSTTALAQIIAAVERAQNSRANIQKLADRVSSVFVPVVILVAIAAGLFWGFWPERAAAMHQALAPLLWKATLAQSALGNAILCMVAVLIVACPCAMGLATPAAIMAGSNAAAERGILIRDGEALEKSGRITAVLFDKTGTITRGQMTVAAHEQYPLEHGLPFSLLNLAVALAKSSQHPLSQAIAALHKPGGGEHQPAPVNEAGFLAREPVPNDPNHFNEPPVPLDQWREIKGSGVMGIAQNSAAISPKLELRLGSMRWLEECGVDTRPARLFTQEWSNQAATILGLSVNQTLYGAIALKDAVKPHAASVVEALRQQGKALYLVTGDHATTAQAIARQVGIELDHVHAEIRPEQKAQIIIRLQAQGHRVAFVGDGINDAPALAQADLGIAVSRASDIARESADIILLNSDIQAVPEALGLAQKTLRVIKQNLFWAFFYNALAVPLAAMGFLSPILCAAAMGVSDLIVIGNALRLRKHH